MNNNKLKNKTKLITPDIKIAELLEEYPQLEQKLISYSPHFEKLKNPFLRRTVARVTTLRQAAVIGGVSISEIINGLRKEINQDEILINEMKETTPMNKPEWLNEEKIKIDYDATLDLQQGIHPIGKISKDLESFDSSEIFLIHTQFIPAPLIELFKNKGCEVYTDVSDKNDIKTYIQKKNN
ncbi:MAG: DUF1858 domain-containing protein [Ignavibacteria bacterium]|jgi:hypothetical protein|nr:DUF1858 domain-containing protein [Ignavibacteria bacterium]